MASKEAMSPAEVNNTARGLLVDLAKSMQPWRPIFRSSSEVGMPTDQRVRRLRDRLKRRLKEKWGG